MSCEEIGHHYLKDSIDHSSQSLWGGSILKATFMHIVFCFNLKLSRLKQFKKYFVFAIMLAIFLQNSQSEKPEVKLGKYLINNQLDC